MKTINCYLALPGKCREAMEFYKSVLGGELSIMTMDGTPMADKVPAEYLDNVMHAELRNENMILFASDCMPGTKVTFGDQCTVSLNVDNDENAEDLFNKLSEGGEITMPFETQFWGDNFGMFTDKFGINWMLNQG